MATQREKDYNRRRAIAIHDEAILAYNDHCVNCGESRIELLVLDHIFDDGAQHRAELGCSGGTPFYRKMKKQGWPQGRLQVLCSNCNSTKQARGYMPRQPRLLHLTRRKYGNVNIGPDKTSHLPSGPPVPSQRSLFELLSTQEN